MMSSLTRALTDPDVAEGAVGAITKARYWLELVGARGSQAERADAWRALHEGFGGGGLASPISYPAVVAFLRNEERPC